MDAFSYSELFKSLPASQQQHFSHNVQPEVAAGYLFALQNQNKKKKRRATVSPEDIGNTHPHLNLNDPAVAADLAVKKRRKGADPRKCYNETCDRIVTKRNYCYKCQKRKERGLALNPKLPSIKQLLLPSDKKKASKKNASPSDSLPTVNDINNSINSTTSQESSPSTFLPFNIMPNIKDSDKVPNYFETVLVNLMKERNERNPLPSPSSQSSNSFINNSEFSASDKQQLQNLHQYLLQLSNGSEDKASSLLFQYISARNAQTPAPSHPLTPSHTIDQISHSISLQTSSSNIPFVQSQTAFSTSVFPSTPTPFSPFHSQSSDLFNLFSPHSTSSFESNSSSNNQIKFGSHEMNLLPNPLSIRPNLFTTPDHQMNTSSPSSASSFPFAHINNVNSSTSNSNNRMRFF